MSFCKQVLLHMRNRFRAERTKEEEIEFRHGRRKYLKFLIPLIILTGTCVMAQTGTDVPATNPNDIGFTFGLEGKNFSRAVNIFMLVTVLSMVPAFMMMMTSFTRIVIVLGFLGKAMGTQNSPSPKILSALALFLTFFIMEPIWTDIYNNALKPFSDKKITESVALDRAVKPLKKFMISQTREKSLLMFMDLAKEKPKKNWEEVPMRVVVPSFMVSELQTAFQMGFLIFLPFLLIDAVVATLLMSMGMMMLPPMMVSLPFKLLLFIMCDGWNIVVKALVSSFSR